jgi:hypothetical protein
VIGAAGFWIPAAMVSLLVVICAVNALTRRS